MDICYHLICECVEDGIVKIKFINSEEIDADLFMNWDIYLKSMQKKLVWKHEEVDVKVQQEGCQKMPLTYLVI